MKFSIIIPVHNAEKYLNDCIDSIYNQDMTDATDLLFKIMRQDPIGKTNRR